MREALASLVVTLDDISSNRRYEPSKTVIKRFYPVSDGNRCRDPQPKTKQILGILVEEFKIDVIQMDHFYPEGSRTPQGDFFLNRHRKFISNFHPYIFTQIFCP